MHDPFFRKLRFLSLPALLLGMQSAAQAGVGVDAALARAFAGTYQLSDVAEDGSTVHLTMTLTLRNPGNTDVHGGIVAVLDSRPDPVLLGSFSAIKLLPHQSRITVSQALTLSAAEYANWQHGHGPRLEFLIPSGQTAVAAGIQAYQVALPPTRSN